MNIDWAENVCVGTALICSIQDPFSRAVNHSHRPPIPTPAVPKTRIGR